MFFFPVVPQIAIIAGPLQAVQLFSALMDFTIMTRENAYMFITGPQVIKAVTGRNVTMDEVALPLFMPVSPVMPTSLRKMINMRLNWPASCSVSFQQYRRSSHRPFEDMGSQYRWGDGTPDTGRCRRTHGCPVDYRPASR